MVKAINNDKLVEQVNELFERGVLIDLDVSWWAGQAGLRPEDIGIPKENINLDLFSLGRKRFIPKNWIGRFRKYEQKGRQVVAAYSFHYKRNGGWFVPLTAVEKLVAELEDCKAKFWGIVNEFAKQYPTIKVNMIEAYDKESPKIYKRLQSLGAELPSFDVFKTKFMSAVRAFYPKDPTVNFKYSWSFEELTLPRQFEVKAANLKKKLQSAETERQKQRLLVQKYNDAFGEQVNSFLNSVVKELRGATVELAKKIGKQVAEGKVTDNRIDRLKEYISRFRLLNFVDDNEVEKALDDLNKNLEHSAEEYNTNKDLEDALRGSLSAVVKVASQNGRDVLAASFGTKRKIVRKKK